MLWVSKITGSTQYIRNYANDKVPSTFIGRLPTLTASSTSGPRVTANQQGVSMVQSPSQEKDWQLLRMWEPPYIGQTAPSSPLHKTWTALETRVPTYGWSRAELAKMVEWISYLPPTLPLAAVHGPYCVVGSDLVLSPSPIEKTYGQDVLNLWHL